MQPPYSGSVIKVLLPKVGRREISYATELRLFVFAPLTSMKSFIFVPLTTDMHEASLYVNHSNPNFWRETGRIPSLQRGWAFFIRQIYFYTPSEAPPMFIMHSMINL